MFVHVFYLIQTFLSEKGKVSTDFAHDTMKVHVLVCTLLNVNTMFHQFVLRLAGFVYTKNVGILWVTMGISSLIKKSKTYNFPIVEKYSYHMIILFYFLHKNKKQSFERSLIFVQRLRKMFQVSDVCLIFSISFLTEFLSFAQDMIIFHNAWISSIHYNQVASNV